MSGPQSGKIAGGVSGGDTSETPPVCGVGLRPRSVASRGGCDVLLSQHNLPPQNRSQSMPQNYALTLSALLELGVGLVALEFSKFRMSS